MMAAAKSQRSIRIINSVAAGNACRQIGIDCLKKIDISHKGVFTQREAGILGKHENHRMVALGDYTAVAAQRKFVVGSAVKINIYIVSGSIDNDFFL